MWGGVGEGVFFFFQAEDGIRDYDVTGVQTCALPIWLLTANRRTPTFRQHGLRVFLDLLGRFEILVVDPVVLVFTIGRGVIAADLWPGFVDAAQMIVLQVSALGMDQDVPAIFFGKD